MKILIDNSNLVAGGGIQVATSFLYDLKEINDTNTFYHVIQSPNSAKSIDKNKFSKNFIFYDLDDETTKSKTKRIKKVKEIENKISPNTIFVTFGPSYHKSSFPKIVGFAIPYIIYSDSPFFEKISFIEKLKYKGLDILKRKMFITNSDVLIFETENARQIFCEKIKFNKPTYTVGNTLNSIFNRKEEWTEISIQKTGIDVLFLTANYAHKNIQIVPQIIDEILKIDKEINFKFYISVTKEELNFDEKYNHYIQYLGRVEQEKIPSLYSQMDIVLMPTLLEIFSTTYLEAMHMQVPIIASDMGFARDICLDSVLYSSPLNAKDYAEKILMLSENSNLRNELITKGTENLKRFGTSMDRTQKYLEIIKEYANQR